MVALVLVVALVWMAGASVCAHRLDWEIRRTYGYEVAKSVWPQTRKRALLWPIPDKVYYRPSRRRRSAQRALDDGVKELTRG